VETIPERYRRLAAAMTATVEGVAPTAWTNPSPCHGWTARDVVGHLVDVHGRFQALVGRSLVAHPPVEQDPLGAFVAVRDQMQADLEDPVRLEEEYDGRFGRSTFGAAVDGFVCFDLVVHRWDLARATGQDETMDPTDVAQIQEAVDRMGPVMRENGVIGPRLEPRPDASLQERLLCALGRRP
jgi:uncharacterized protein (TIGR03086 family)